MSNKIFSTNQKLLKPKKMLNSSNQRELLHNIAQSARQLNYPNSLAVVTEEGYQVIGNQETMEQYLSSDRGLCDLFYIAIEKMGRPDSNVKVWRGREDIIKKLQMSH